VLRSCPAPPDPRWGRCLEVPSECPLLTGEYAMGYVGGMQARDKSGRYRKTICNAKHWSSYDVERGIDPSPGPRSFDPANGWPEGGEQYNRGSFNAFVSEQDLAETYWPQFRAAVRGAELGGTMCSYLLRQIFLLILSPFRLTDFFDGAGTMPSARRA